MNKKTEIAVLAAKANLVDPAAYGNACARRDQMVAEGTPKQMAIEISAVWFRGIIAGTYKFQLA